MQMGTVFKQRFPKAEIITAEFVNYADEYMALEERLAAAATAAAAAAKASEAGDESASDTASKSVPEEEAGAKKEGERAKKASDVGTVVFNAVFGNLWDQGSALERAAAILEVRWRVRGDGSLQLRLWCGQLFGAAGRCCCCVFFFAFFFCGARVLDLLAGVARLTPPSCCKMRQRKSAGSCFFHRDPRPCCSWLMIARPNCRCRFLLEVAQHLP